MTASAESEYLDHLNELMRAEATFTRVTDKRVHPAIFSIQYSDAPDSGWITAFTAGLSSVPNLDWDPGSGPELALQIRSRDRAWGYAIAEVARQGRGKQVLEDRMPIDFCEAISDESEMSGFLLLAPKRFPATPLCCSGRHIYFLEAIPLYPSEVQGIRKFGPKPFLKASPDFADPRRPVVELA